jgi:predicted RNA binding protein YcfA (HicA-like mRNA interferase family)
MRRLGFISDCTLRKLARTAEKQGWEVTRTNGNHLKWKPPAGRFIITAATPDDARTYRNTLAMLRRAGLSTEG